MSFQILDYLDKLDIVKEYPSWVLVVCPVCGGKLKISKAAKYGAYSCVSNWCEKQDKNLIRKKLYNKNSIFSSNVFSNNKTYSNLVKVVKSIKLDTDIQANTFLTTAQFKFLKQIRNDTTITSYFDYIDFQIVRVDNKDKSIQKYFYPLYIDSTGKEVKEIPNKLTSLPIYRTEYIQSNLIFVEGEKCAYIGQYLGLAAITFANFIFSDRYIDRYAKKLYELGVRNVIYLQDNDTTGLHKSKQVCNYFNKNKIATKNVNLTTIFTEYKDVQGFDLFDLYKRGRLNKKNVLDFVKKCLEEV